MNARLLALCLAAGLACPVLEAATPAAAPAPASKSPEQVQHERVLQVMSRMTLEDMVGQLVQYSSPSLVTGPAGQANVEREIRAGRAGAVLNYIGAKRTRELQEIAVKQSRLGIPLLFGYDVIHGYRTIFPINLGQAASFDLAAIERSERIAATEASACGINWTFAPMVDIARDPRWGRISEGSGEDTFLTSEITRARIRGFQGQDLSRNDTILACAKHFAAYGAAQAGRDYWTTDMSVYTLRDVYLPPFKAAVDAGVGTFMAAFNDLNGIPASANPGLLDHVLRREWGFRGFVVSDWSSVKELIAHGYAEDGRKAAELSFNAGVDMDMESSLFGPHIAQAVFDGTVAKERVQQAVYTILMAKARLGLFDDPYRYSDSRRELSDVLTKEHLEASRDLARKSCVLLQNNDSVLPLKKGVRIAVVGPLADSTRDLIGSWQAQGREEDVVSFRESFEKAGKNEVIYARGCDISGDDRSGFEEAVKAVKRSTAAIVVLGEGWEMTGEASSRTSLELPGVQLELLKQLHATKRPIILVLMSGRPLLLGEARKYADAILFAWYPGTMGGPALVDLLTGKVSPSGKLPVSFPRSVGQVPLFYNHKVSGRPVDEASPGEKFRSRYLDSPNSPEFPFGFGLSYTSFAYPRASLSASVLTPGASLRVSATVENRGKMAADEVVQLYVRDLVGSVTRPVRELKGFARVSLKPGERREVEFTLRPEDLAFTRPDLSFGPEPGQFEVFLGGDSNAPKIGAFEYREP